MALHNTCTLRWRAALSWLRFQVWSLLIEEKGTKALETVITSSFQLKTDKLTESHNQTLHVCECVCAWSSPASLGNAHSSGLWSIRTLCLCKQEVKEHLFVTCCDRWLVLVNYQWKALTSWKCGFFSKLWEFSHNLTRLLHTPAVRVLSLWHGLDESDPTNQVSKRCRSSTVWPPRPPSLTASLFSRAGLWLVEKQ